MDKIALRYILKFKIKKGVYCCAAAKLPSLSWNSNPTLLQLINDIVPVTHCPFCSFSCSCSISCSESLPFLFPPAYACYRQMLLLNQLEAAAINIANIPTLWVFVMLLIIIRMYNLKLIIS